MQEYNHRAIEISIQQLWEEMQCFYAQDSDKDTNTGYEQKCKSTNEIEGETNQATENKKKKFYCLSMFLYPSGKLHIGHVRNYTIGDAIARFHRLKGYNVLQPIGWDAFGLPAENAAINNNTSPFNWTIQNIAQMGEQMRLMGFSFDWSRELITCNPDYYRHQQWLFIQMYKRGLVYKKEALVNWDPVDNTVLANEQVIDGKGWRSGAIVEKRSIAMYYFKITAYSEELLQDLDKLKDQWPNQVIEMQKNWIGKSSGVSINMLLDYNGQIANKNINKIKIFTTRPDTIYGVSYIAISIDHELAKLLALNSAEIKHFIEKVNADSAITESNFAKTAKIGIYTQINAIHPLTKELIPIWIANYVLSGYGEGAIMGVPAHCANDLEFALLYNLPIKTVIIDQADINKYPNQQISHKQETYKQATHEQMSHLSQLINSDVFNHLSSIDACEKITNHLIEMNIAKRQTHYRLRDWAISRQRYWGCPIPVIYCDNCGEVLLRDEDLPVVLPTNLIPDGSSSPLAKCKEFLQTTCHLCNSPTAIREADTMDTFVDSSWYFLRYTSPKHQDGILEAEKINYWNNVDQYVGGVEHAVLHLLYARFINKVIRDLGLISFDEPFARLLTQGMVVANTYYYLDTAKNNAYVWVNENELDRTEEIIRFKDQKKQLELEQKGYKIIYGGLEKMSKSKNNGIDPQDIILQYGADALRLFVLFASPPNLSLEWSHAGIDGAIRFLRKIWQAVYNYKKYLNQIYQDNIKNQEFFTQITSFSPIYEQFNTEEKSLCQLLKNAIIRAENDYANRQQYNTIIAMTMELVNAYNKYMQNIHQEKTNINQEKMCKLSIDKSNHIRSQDDKSHSKHLQDNHLQNNILQEENVIIALPTNLIISKILLSNILLILSPIVPHISEYLWLQINHFDTAGHDTIEQSLIIDKDYIKLAKFSIQNQLWPIHEKILSDDILSNDTEQVKELIIQINGKMRKKLLIANLSNLTEEELKNLVLQDEVVAKYTLGDNSKIDRCIIVKNKLVNIVIN